MNLKIINISTFGYDRFVDAEMEDKSKIIVHFTEYADTDRCFSALRFL